MIGIDEVGRGSWAGPLLVVAARALPNAKMPPDLTDSKLLSNKKRQQINSMLIECCEFGLGWVSAAQIDRVGLSQALKDATRSALNSVSAGLNEPIIIDGKINFAPKKYKQVSCIVKADMKNLVVSAASVHAKVVRDNYMRGIANKYSDYGFEKHVGYGTKNHVLAIKNFGVLKGVHRTSYKPIMQIITASGI